MSDPGNPSNPTSSGIGAGLKLSINWNKNKVRATRKTTDSHVQEIPTKRQRQCDLTITPSVSTSTPTPPAETNITQQSHYCPENFPSFLQQVDDKINALLRNDNILKDLADRHHNEESCEVIPAFESGQGARINLKREDSSVLPILIKKSETVRGLMKRIEFETERELKLMCTGKRNQRAINWRHVWRQNLLVRTEDKVKLEDCSLKLKDVGLVNNTEVRFVKRVREKNKNPKIRKKKGVKAGQFLQN